MILTSEERKRFVEYLERSIESTRLIIEQMEKLRGCEMLRNDLRAEMVAEIRVVSKLRSFTSVEIA